MAAALPGRVLALGALAACVACSAVRQPTVELEAWSEAVRAGREQEVAEQVDGQAVPWTPPEPREDDADWIQLTSGEWLRGEIKELRRDSLEFDSDELDVLTLDWADVALLRSATSCTLLFEGRVQVTGPVLVQGGRVLVGGETPGEYDRAQLLALVPGKPSEGNYWSGKISLGASTRTGNTEQTDVNSLLTVRRRTASSRLDLTYTGYYSEIQNVVTTNNSRFTGRWSTYVRRRLYLIPLSLEAYRDPFVNIDLQLTPSAGLGYTLVDGKQVEWDAGAALGYRFTRFESVPAGDPEQEETPALTVGTELDVDVTKSIELGFDYSVQIGLDEASSTDQHLRALVSFDVIGDLDFDVTLAWDRVGNPPQDASGNFPDKDDFRVTIGIGWEF